MQKKTILIISTTMAAFLILITPWIIIAFVKIPDEEVQSSVLFLAASKLLLWGWIFAICFAGYGLKEIWGWRVNSFLKITFILLLLIALVWAVILGLLVCTFEMPA